MTDPRRKKPDPPIDLKSIAAGCRELSKPSDNRLGRVIEHIAKAADEGRKPAPLPDDLKDFTYSFLAPPRFFISVSVPESLYHQLRGYGISRFFEDATNKFDGDLKALVEAALQFIAARKNRKPTEGICNANGRVLKETLQKIEGVQASIAGIKGMSRAKVLAGLVQLKLNAMK